MPAHGTPEWARWAIAHNVPDSERETVETLVMHATFPWASLHRARKFYGVQCHERRWEGWLAHVVWAILEATVKPLEDDDIPF